MITRHCWCKNCEIQDPIPLPSLAHNVCRSHFAQRKPHGFQELLSRRKASLFQSLQKNVVERKHCPSRFGKSCERIAKAGNEIEHDVGGILRVGNIGSNISLPHPVHASGQAGDAVHTRFHQQFKRDLRIRSPAPLSMRSVLQIAVLISNMFLFLDIPPFEALELRRALRSQGKRTYLAGPKYRLETKSL